MPSILTENVPDLVGQSSRRVVPVVLAGDGGAIDGSGLWWRRIRIEAGRGTGLRWLPGLGRAGRCSAFAALRRGLWACTWLVGSMAPRIDVPGEGRPGFAADAARVRTRSEFGFCCDAWVSIDRDRRLDAGEQDGEPRQSGCGFGDSCRVEAVGSGVEGEIVEEPLRLAEAHGEDRGLRGHRAGIPARRRASW